MGGSGDPCRRGCELFSERQAAPRAIHPAPLPAWTAAEHPYPPSSWSCRNLTAAHSTTPSCAAHADDARKDVLTWGEPAAAGPMPMVEIFRPGRSSERFLDASSEIAARIIAYTVTDDVKPAGEIDSKFGPVPLVDFAIAPQGHRQRRCLGFARAFDDPAMQIAGWYCSAGAGSGRPGYARLHARPAHHGQRRQQARRRFLPTPRSSARSAVSAARSSRRRRNARTMSRRAAQH